MNYIKELMIDYGLSYEEAQDYYTSMIDEARDCYKYEGNYNDNK